MPKPGFWGRAVFFAEKTEAGGLLQGHSEEVVLALELGAVANTLLKYGSTRCLPWLALIGSWRHRMRAGKTKTRRR